MGIIAVAYTFSPNTTISSSNVNANFTTMYNEFNGSISAANLAAGAVTTAKIADANVTTAKLALGAITPAQQTTTKYAANVATSGAVTSTSYANFPTNRCKVDVVTANANAVVLVTYTAGTAYANATGSAFLQLNVTGANTATSTYERQVQNSDGGQELPCSYMQIFTLATAGTTTFEMQIKGSSTASCTAKNVILNAVVLQDKG